MSDIKDIKLAPSGHDKIDWVASYMPILNTIKEDFIKNQPFKGLKISMSIHLEAKTAYLAKVLKAGGAEVWVTGCNPLSTQDDVAAALVEDGFEVNAWRGVSNEQYEAHLIKTLSLLKPIDYLHVTLIDKNGNTGSKAQLNVIPTDDPARVKISMGAIVTVNHRKFVKEVQPVLKDVLEKLCFQKSSPLILNDNNGYKPHKIGFKVSDDGVLETTSYAKDLQIVTGETATRSTTKLRGPYSSSPHRMIGIALNESRRYNAEQQNFVCYFFPRTKVLEDFLHNHIYNNYSVLTFILKDQDGEEIKRYSQKILDGQYDHAILHFYGSGLTEYGISPEIMHNGPDSFSSCKQFSITFEMKQSDVKDIRSMELVLEGRK